MRRSYQQTVEYLFSLLPMYQRTGSFVGKFDLSKTHALMSALGHPAQKFKAVHIAGTNGKGSTSHALATLFSAAGWKTGLYTSPHYVDFRERIRIDGQMISEVEVINFTEAQAGLIEDLQPSFFEFTVAMAFHHFADQQVDIAIIETGMGGRLDSTNVIQPLLSVITQIDLDHMEYLGDSLGKIASEKAGIIKKSTPVVIGTFQKESWPVFAGFAERLDAPIHLAKDLINIEERDGVWKLESASEKVKIDPQLLSMQGPFALENLRTSLAAYEILRPILQLGPPRLEALNEMDHWSGYRGRFMELDIRPDLRQNKELRILADAGHNPAAWSRLAPEIQRMRGPNTLHVVCGFVRGKQPSDFLSLWDAETRFYLGELDLPRKLPNEEAIPMIENLEIAIEVLPGIPEALQSAIHHARQGDLVFVGGSSFVVGAALGWLEQQA